MKELKIKPLRENIILPTRGHPTDAGLDLYWNPINEEEVDCFKTSWWEKNFFNFRFSTGIAIDIDEGYYAEVKNRSSMASNKKILVGACVIDAGYRGEIFVDLHFTPTSEKLNRGDKIAQLVILPVVIPEIKIVDSFEGQTSRGKNGFGSTDV